jgi:ATP-dependent Clp protease adaptor protein ClpS
MINPLNMAQPDRDSGDGTKSEVLTKQRVKRPPLYRVIMLNDDYTTQEFVILVLRRFFHKSNEEAQALMRAIHNTGRGVAGVYPHDIAVTKVQQVRAAAQQNSMPLRLTIEPDR